MRNDLGIYLHVPFCLKKCDYCDFCSQHSDEETVARYVSCLAAEIDGAAPYSDRPVATVYIGGGTPSLLKPAQMETLVSAIRRRFAVDEDAEWTMEANPATVTKESASAYRALGINRVSIGVQSLRDTELRAIGRIHTARDALQCVDIFERAGFERISLDLMYGLPSQTLSSFRTTLRSALSLSHGHLSVYGLMLEEGTPLYRRRAALALPSEDEERAMYDLACDACASEGYAHYEISNYAREGEACRHNLRYWALRDYLGFGIAACGCVGALRYGHTESLAAYLAGDTGVRVLEKRSDGEIDLERVMLGLRTSHGVCSALFDRTVGGSHTEFLERCTRAGYLLREGDAVRLSDSGMYLSSGILAEILPDFVSIK